MEIEGGCLASAFAPTLASGDDGSSLVAEEEVEEEEEVGMEEEEEEEEEEPLTSAAAQSSATATSAAGAEAEAEDAEGEAEGAETLAEDEDDEDDEEEDDDDKAAPGASPKAASCSALNVSGCSRASACSAESAEASYISRAEGARPLRLLARRWRRRSLARARPSALRSRLFDKPRASRSVGETVAKRSLRRAKTPSATSSAGDLTSEEEIAVVPADDDDDEDDDDGGFLGVSTFSSPGTAPSLGRKGMAVMLNSKWAARLRPYSWFSSRRIRRIAVGVDSIARDPFASPARSLLSASLASELFGILKAA